MSVHQISKSQNAPEIHKHFGLYSKFQSINSFTQILTFSSCSVLSFNCLTLFCLSFPSSCVMSERLSVWHSLTWRPRRQFINMMSHVSPFQRDSPADTADYTDNVIRRRLKVWNCSGFCPAWECFEFTWPVRPSVSLSVCLSVGVLFCFCVIYVFSAASVAPERACLSDECEIRILWLSGAESGVSCSLGQISKKDAGVYEVVLKDDRGKDTSTLNLKDHGRSARSRLGYILIYQVDHFLCSPLGFKDLMNEVFGFIGKKPFFQQITCYLIYLWMHIWLWIQTAANSSTPLKITSTDQGIRLYTFVSYYNDLLQITWHFKWVLRPGVHLCECLFEISDLIVMCRPQEHGHRLFWPHQERRGWGADIPADHRAHGEGHGRVRHRVLRWEGRREEEHRAVRSRWGWVNPALSQPNKSGHLEITVLFCSLWGCFCRIPETQVSWSIIISFTSHQSQHKLNYFLF